MIQRYYINELDSPLNLVNEAKAAGFGVEFSPKQIHVDMDKLGFNWSLIDHAAEELAKAGRNSNYHPFQR